MKLFMMFAVLVVAVEVILHFLAASKKKKMPAYKQCELSPYQNCDWAEDAFRERKITKFHYDFLLKRRTAFSGRTLSIDAEGRRKTWNPELPQGGGIERMLMMGNSCLWGKGVRDEHTIPSEVSRLLNDQKTTVEIHNCAEDSSTFMQEVVRLLFYLRESENPDGVVFYNGINNAFAALQTGRICHLHFEDELQNTLAETTPLKKLAEGARQSLTRHSHLVRLARDFRNTIYGKAAEPDGPMKAEGNKLLCLAEELADDYEKSYRFVETLSDAFGFKFHCFLQPAIFTKDPITPEERRASKMSKRKKLGDLYVAFCDALEKKRLPQMTSLTRCLNGIDKTLYFDFDHTTEEANAVIAASMANGCRGLLKQD